MGRHQLPELPYQTSLDTFLLCSEVALIVNGVMAVSCYELVRNTSENVVNGKMREGFTLTHSGYNQVFYYIWLASWGLFLLARYALVAYKLWVLNPRLYGARLENTMAKQQKRVKQRLVTERKTCSVVLSEEAHLLATG